MTHTDPTPIETYEDIPHSTTGWFEQTTAGTVAHLDPECHWGKGLVEEAPWGDRAGWICHCVDKVYPRTESAHLALVRAETRTKPIDEHRANVAENSANRKHAKSWKSDAPSDKQMAFLRRLLEERPGLDLQGLCDTLDNKGDTRLDPESIDAFCESVEKGSCSRAIDLLLNTPSTGAAAADTATQPAPTDKQEGFLRSLLAQHGMDADATIEDMRTEGLWTRPGASAKIDQLKSAPTPTNVVVTEEGFYTGKDGEIYKVQHSKTGNPYAKRLVGVTEGTKPEWEYIGKAPLHQLDRKLTLAEAKDLGKVTGHCCVCSRKLTDEDSIEAGIGPVCEARF